MAGVLGVGQVRISFAGQSRFSQRFILSCTIEERSNLAMPSLFVALLPLLLILASVTGATAQVTNRSEHQLIDCTASRLSVPGQHHCRMWSVDYKAYQRPSVWHEDSQTGPECTREIGSVQVNAARYFGSVRYMMPNPGAHFDCTVPGRLSINLNRMRSISKMTEAAIEMAHPQSSGDRFVSAFTSEKGLACRAFVLLGPVAQTRYHNRDVRQYRIQGHVCPKGGAVLTDAEFEAFLGSIQFRPG